MGRPINKKYFGNLNTPYDDAQTGGPSGEGGEGVASTIVIGSTGSHYSLGSVAVFSAPQLPAGTTAAGDLTISAPGAGGITAVTLTSAGSGYTGTATITITTATGVLSTTNFGTQAANTMTVSSTAGIYVGMIISGGATGSAGYVTAINGNVITSTVANNNTFTNASNLNFFDVGSGFSAVTALTNVNDNALAVYAFVPGGSSGVIGDIMKQEASRRYLVKTAQGVGQCKLVAVATGSLVAGEMNLVATDANNSTYYVTKLTSRRATLTRKTMGSSYLFATGDVANWTLDAASGSIVSIANV